MESKKISVRVTYPISSLFLTSLVEIPPHTPFLYLPYFDHLHILFSIDFEFWYVLNGTVDGLQPNQEVLTNIKN